jgi:phosphatidylinositol alpha-1,6-mannosyltransferase
MRIALITSEMLPRYGGIESYVAGLVPELARDNVVGLISEPGQWLPAPPPSVVQLLHTPLARIDSRSQATASARAVHSALAAFDPDVIQLASAGLAVYADALPAGVPRVVTVHGNDLTQPWQRVPGGEPRAAILAGLQACDTLVAVSRHTARLAREFGVTAPLVLGPPACDADRFSPLLDGSPIRWRHQIPDEIPIVLTVARLAPRKGHLFLLDSLCRVRSPMHWIAVGDGQLRYQLEAAVRRSPLVERCTITGRVTDAVLPGYYAACTVFAAAPEQRHTGDGVDSEGYGVVFSEAAAAGRPVVTTAAGGVAEAVVDGRTGIVLDGRDAGRFAAAVERLLLDRELGRQLGSNGRQHVLAGRSWRSAAQELLEIYARLVARRSTSAAVPIGESDGWSHPARASGGTGRMT